MSVEYDIATLLLDTMKSCVESCEVYERFPISLGDPNIECSMIGVGIQSFSPSAQVANCSVYEFVANIVVAQCCYPIGGSDGSPPPVGEINQITECLTNDVEAILCCLQNIALDITGAISPCRPKFSAVNYSRPLGTCVSAKLGVSIMGVPCCD